MSPAIETVTPLLHRQRGRADPKLVHTIAPRTKATGRKVPAVLPLPPTRSAGAIICAFHAHMIGPIPPRLAPYSVPSERASHIRDVKICF